MVVLKKINHIFRIFCATLLIIMTALVAFQVISRKFLHMSVAQVEEIARYCMVWVGLLGASIGITTNSHVAVELFIHKLPKKIKLIIGAITYIIISLFFIILLYFGSLLTKQAMFQISPSMSFLKMGFIMAVIPLSGALGIYNLVFSLWYLIKYGYPLSEKTNLTENLVQNKERR